MVVAACDEQKDADVAAGVVVGAAVDADRAIDIPPPPVAR